MLGIIILGAHVFSTFFALTQVTQSLVTWVGALKVSIWVILLMLVLMYVVLGCFLDQMAILVLTVPIVAPMLKALGVDLIWFGVVIIVTAELGMVTPPFGLNAFVVSKYSRTPLREVFSGVTPHIIAHFIAIGIMLAFPGTLALAAESDVGCADGTVVWRQSLGTRGDGAGAVLRHAARRHGSGRAPVDRPGPADQEETFAPGLDLRGRNKRSVSIDLKQPKGRETVLRLASKADVLLEGFRPGVVERLGIGPDACLALNPALVYGRATGWGREGPLAQAAGHDINYIALTGALDMIGPKDGAPVPPLNLVGDYGGGALYLAFGVTSALVEARGSGRGQVVDAAMVDGVTSLLTVFHAFRQGGTLVGERGSNGLDGGAPYYTTYKTHDQRYVAVGAIEPRFYAVLIEKLGLDARNLPQQSDRASLDRATRRPCSAVCNAHARRMGGAF